MFALYEVFNVKVFFLYGEIDQTKMLKLDILIFDTKKHIKGRSKGFVFLCVKRICIRFNGFVYETFMICTQSIGQNTM